MCDLYTPSTVPCRKIILSINNNKFLFLGFTPQDNYTGFETISYDCEHFLAPIVSFYVTNPTHVVRIRFKGFIKILPDPNSELDSLKKIKLEGTAAQN